MSGCVCVCLCVTDNLCAKCSQEIPALTLNRLCGSGFESIITGVKNISIGESNLIACGGLPPTYTLYPHIYIYNEYIYVYI